MVRTKGSSAAAATAAAEAHVQNMGGLLLDRRKWRWVVRRVVALEFREFMGFKKQFILAPAAAAIFVGKVSEGWFIRLMR